MKSPSSVLNKISPPVGSYARMMDRAVVLFPQPLSPTKLSVSPSRMSKLMPSTALTVPTVLRKNPRLIGKCLTRPRTSRSGAGPLPLLVVSTDIYDPSYKKQLTSCSSLTLISFGSFASQVPSINDWQRGWKGHPIGRS